LDFWLRINLAFASRSFVLTGIAVSLLVCSFSLVKEQWTARIPRLAIIDSAWAASFATCYFVSLRHAANNRPCFLSGKQPSFRLLSYRSTRRNGLSAHFRYFSQPRGIELTGLAALSFLVGLLRKIPSLERYYVRTAQAE